MFKTAAQNSDQVIFFLFICILYYASKYTINLSLHRSKKFEDNSLAKLDTSVDKTTIEICVNAIDKHLNELQNEQWSKSALKNLETKLLFLEKRSSEISVCINSFYLCNMN